MLKSILAASVVGLGLASAASAAVTVTVQNVGAPVYTSAGATVAGYSGYIIRVVSDSGAISAYDFQSATNGITGRLVQRLTASDPDGSPGVYDTASPSAANINATPGTPLNLDSHFYNAATQTFVGMTTAETYGTGATVPTMGTKTDPAFPANSAGTGYEISGANGALKGYSGIDSASQSTSQIVAYIVASNTTTITGTGLISAVGSATALPVSFTIVPVTTPDPLHWL